jgi:Alr-MurF fusion protein
MSEKSPVTTLDIDLGCVVRNLNRVREQMNGKGVICVIKAFGYGSDDIALAKLLQKQNVEYLAVSCADEGIRLREAGVTSRILILIPDNNDFDDLGENDLEPTLLSIEHLEAYVVWAKKRGWEDLPVHINLNTGMNRLGFEVSDHLEIERIIAESDLTVATVYSHLAGSDDHCLDEKTLKQLEIFDAVCSKFSFPFKRHILNSSGVARFPDHKYDYVRVGLCLLGLDESRKEWGLEPAVSFKTIVTQIRRLSAGEGLSYGFTGAESSDRDIAWLPVGYADGYPRCLGNGIGYVFIKGVYAKSVGRVCMGLVAIDVTGLGVVEGEKVELFGRNLCVIELAKKAETISYELLSRVHGRVARTTTG